MLVVWCFLWQGQESCGFWAWLDPEICERSKQVIPGLLKKIQQLESEISSITATYEEPSDLVDKIHNMPQAESDIQSYGQSNHTVQDMENKNIKSNIKPFLFSIVIVMVLLYLKY